MAYDEVFKKILNIDDPMSNISGFLNSLNNIRWFEKIGQPHPLDHKLQRVFTFREAADTRYSLQLISGKKYEMVIDRYYLNGYDYILDLLDSAVREYMLKILGIWDSTHIDLELNFAHGMLAETVVFASTSLWIKADSAWSWFSAIIRYYIQGYYPCGWNPERNTFIVY